MHVMTACIDWIFLQSGASQRHGGELFATDLLEKTDQAFVFMALLYTTTFSEKETKSLAGICGFNCGGLNKLLLRLLLSTINFGRYCL